jgi:hypothetical protein
MAKTVDIALFCIQTAVCVDPDGRCLRHERAFVHPGSQGVFEMLKKGL